MTSAALATPADLPTLRRLLQACADGLAADGFRNWIDFDVGASLERDLAEREVWLHREAGRILGTWTIGLRPLRPYPPGFWPPDEAPILWLNRLAIDPAAQRRGLGAHCMRDAEARARALGCGAIRLDYLSANEALGRFYHGLGYEPVGAVARGAWTFAACEKRLPPHD
ncbi:MAG TPA: GNAT family N-acetyltransferase [Gemmatimonadaceae bacterium]|nr:GNAT family N-acetyltransferase [Gemmatimonadaceae bacterium]